MLAFWECLLTGYDYDTELGMSHGLVDKYMSAPSGSNGLKDYGP